MFDPFGEEEGADKPPRPPFPSPVTALLLTFGASLASVVIALALFEKPDVAALGIGEALGVGGVATLAARRVPDPQPERLGLRGFSPRFGLMLICLVPMVFIASELDNWGRELDELWLPPTAVEAPLPDGAEPGASTTSAAAGNDANAAPVTGPGLEAEAGDPRSIFDDPPKDWALVEIAIVSVGIAPVVEGFLFFGVILQGLVTILGQRRGLILTGSLYALSHLVAQVGLEAGPAQTLVGLFSLVVIGATLGLCRLATGSVLAPILVATGFIAIQLVSLVSPELLPVPGFNVELDSHTPLAVMAPAIASVAWGLWFLSRQPSDVLPPA